MKRYVIAVGFLLLVLLVLFGFRASMVGHTVTDIPDEANSFGIGPSDEDISCMQNCVAVGCETGDSDCMLSNSEACGKTCGVDPEPPEPADDGEKCMQECVEKGCDDYDFSCQKLNKESCEDECGMKGDAPDESEMDEEQRCISECVADVDPTLICGNSQEGETGNSVCQKCASDCTYLYEGPCLNDEEIEIKEKACETCEHCYGETIMGPSGEGWDCIVDIQCADASSEFGDDAGTGEANYEEGHEGPGIVGNFFEGVGNFFKNIFGRE